MNTYQKPTVQRVGTFRELTKVGTGQNADGTTIIGDPNGRCDWPQVCRS